MHNAVKQICLCLTIMSWALLFRIAPDVIITWVEEHWGLVAIFFQHHMALVLCLR